MPFAPKDTLPQQHPDVRVYFTGLMILEPTGDDDKACQIFVNSSATRHYLTIEVRRKTANRPDEIMMRHVGPLAFFDPLRVFSAYPHPEPRSSFLTASWSREVFKKERRDSRQPGL